MTTEEFKHALKNHDWYYERSDDPGEYHKGLSNHHTLVDICYGNPELQKLFDEKKATIAEGIRKMYAGEAS